MGLPKWLHLVEQAAPTILMAFGVNPLVAGSVAVGIQQAEALTVPGGDKKEHAKNLGITAATAINALKPGTIDVNALAASLDNGIDAVVAAANVHKKAK